MKKNIVCNALRGMRSLAVVAVGMVLTASMLTGCKKEEVVGMPAKKDVFRKATQSESVVVKNSQDEKDEVVRKASLVFAKAFREVIRDRKDWQKSMIEETKKNSLLQFEVGPFRDKHPDFKVVYDAALEKYAAEQFPVPNSDIFVYVSGMLTNDQSYVPVFVIPNLDVLNPSLDPVVSPGLELDADLDPMSEDEILAYEEKEDQTYDEIQISESEAKAAVTPIFIFSNGVISSGISLSTTISVGSGVVPFSHNQVPGGIYSNTVRIKDLQYRYESSGKSEYAIVAAQAVFGNGQFDPWKYIGSIHYPTYKVDYLIDARFSKNDILSGNMFSTNGYDFNAVFGGTSTPLAYKLFTMAAFEYDWYASVKVISNSFVRNHPTPIELVGRMTYSNNTYISPGVSFTDQEVMQAPGKVIAIDNAKTTYTIKSI